MPRNDRTTVGIALVVSLAALVIGLVALTRGGPKPFPSLAPFIRHSQLDTSRGGLNEAANASIISALHAHGEGVQKITIYRTTITAQRGIVIALVQHDGHRDYFTVILHRTAWSFGQITPGAPPEDSH